MKTKGLDITRLIMSILAIVLGILLLIVVGNYYNDLRNSSAAGLVLGLLLLPIIFLVMACMIINLVLGIMGIKKHLDNKNIALEKRKIKKGGIIFKTIIAIIGLSLPMIIVYICDIVEYNNQNSIAN